MWFIMGMGQDQKGLACGRQCLAVGQYLGFGQYSKPAISGPCVQSTPDIYNQNYMHR